MQTETDITDSIARFKRLHGVVGGTFSGGKITDFHKGWAVVLTSFGKAHYWVRSPFNNDYEDWIASWKRGWYAAGRKLIGQRLT